jgi:putative glutathione S-transferase
MLIDGKWSGPWHPFQASDDKGRFLRQSAPFRRWITPDGSAGPEGQEAFPVEPGRYHLYVALICPWATRTLIARSLKGLVDVVGLSITDPFLTDEGWHFGGSPGATEDRVNGVSYIHELYTRADPQFTGRATVPVLWDTRSGTIVNNESADILRIFDKGYGDLASDAYDLRPDAMARNVSPAQQRRLSLRLRPVAEGL